MIKAALGGVSARQAAAGYGVGISTAILWVRRAHSWEVSARRQGQPKRFKLDAHAAFLLKLIEVTSHISLQEMQTRLKQERGISAGIGTLWRFFRTRAITVKKIRLRLQARAARRQGCARPGLTGSLISTRNDRCSSMRLVRPSRWRACMDAAQEGSACGWLFRMGMCGRPLGRKKNIGCKLLRVIGCCHVFGLCCGTTMAAPIPFSEPGEITEKFPLWMVQFPGIRST